VWDVQSRFTFLNRVDDVYFARVRGMIEHWFASVPPGEQAGLRGRLRANAEAQSASAFWELYLRELLRRTAFVVTHEPKRAHRRRPDFHARGHGTSFYLEARHAIVQEQAIALLGVQGLEGEDHRGSLSGGSERRLCGHRSRAGPEAARRRCE